MGYLYWQEKPTSHARKLKFHQTKGTTLQKVTLYTCRYFTMLSDGNCAIDEKETLNVLRLYRVFAEVNF